MVTMTTPIGKIKRLEGRRTILDEEIKRIKYKFSKEERKKDTRRKILIGSAVLAKIKTKGGSWSEPWHEDSIQNMLNEYLTRDQDRLLFNLPIKER